MQCVLVPAVGPQRLHADVARHLGEHMWGAVASTKTQLLSAFRLPGTPAPALQGGPAIDTDLVQQTAERMTQADDAQQRGTRGRDPPADIGKYLKATGIMETRYMRMLSNLTCHTYSIASLTPRSLYRRHKLHLVTTSLACEMRLAEAPRSPLEVLEEGDGMAVDPQTVESSHKDLTSAHDPVAAQTVQKLEALAVKPSNRNMLSPAGLVANTLSAAAWAASAATAPLANNIQTFTRVNSVAASLQSAAAAGHSSALATMTAVTAAVDSTLNRDRRKKLPAECVSPTEWYVADDHATQTRYFVIQGSDNLDHWKVNLTFDPVTFESEALGVKVHRGVYEAAQVLYDRFLPLVQEQLAVSPFAKICFTGHSLGGSLGSLLMLMFLHRGVMPAVAAAPTYTFGAPAIFCEGAAGFCSAEACTQEGKGKRKGLLERLGLPQGAIRNVVMHRDIVPRAFACDYSLVADLLMRVGDSFRAHPCLKGPHRQVMYSFVGKVMVLQPDEGAYFVKAEREPYHPMLPSHTGLWTLREPSLLTSAAASAKTGARSAASQLSAKVTAKVTSSPAPLVKKPAYVPRDVKEAAFELMDTPHPLDILADSGAYGDDGCISRYHNPDNYTKALAGVVRARVSPWKSLLSGASEASRTLPSSPRWYLPLLEEGGGRVSASGRFATAQRPTTVTGSSSGKNSVKAMPQLQAGHARQRRMLKHGS